LHSDNKIQQVQIKLPDIKLNLNIKGVKNAKQYQSTIRNNINTIERYARELNQVSKREYRIENENQTIRREVASIRERITDTITNTIKRIGNSIKQSIRAISRKADEQFLIKKVLNSAYALKNLFNQKPKIKDNNTYSLTLDISQEKNAILNIFISFKEKIKNIKINKKLKYIEENFEILKKTKLFKEFYSAYDLSEDENKKFKEFLLNKDEFTLRDAITKYTLKKLRIKEKRHNNHNYLSR